MSAQENHFIVIHDTQTNKWYIAEAGDYLPEGCVWDKETHEWVDWHVTFGDESYSRDYEFLRQTLSDYNIFAEFESKVDK